MIELKEVSNNRELKAFVKFPLELYKDNKYFSPPILRDEINTLRKDKNPCFEFCEAKYFLAYREGKIVGRIAGIINHKANEIWNHKYIRFGWIDFIEDIEVAKALFMEIDKWGREAGMTHIEGPMGFSDLDKEGMLVEGFEELSQHFAYYNYPYYPEYLEKLGFTKEVDWVEFKGTNLNFPAEMTRILELCRKRLKNYTNVEIKSHRDIQKHKTDIVNLLNIAYKDIHGYIPVNEKMFDHYFKELFYYTNLDFVSLIRDPNGVLVGFGLAMPTLSKAVKESNGRLFPTGFFKITKAFKKNDSIVLILVAVQPDLQSKGIPLLLIDDINSRLLKNGITNVEVNYMLESNINVQSLWKHFPSKRQHKRRRSYLRQITA